MAWRPRSLTSRQSIIRAIPGTPIPFVSLRFRMIPCRIGGRKTVGSCRRQVASLQQGGRARWPPAEGDI